MGDLGVGSEGRLELIQAVVCQVEWDAHWEEEEAADGETDTARQLC